MDKFFLGFLKFCVYGVSVCFVVSFLVMIGVIVHALNVCGVYWWWLISGKFLFFLFFWAFCASVQTERERDMLRKKREGQYLLKNIFLRG